MFLCLCAFVSFSLRCRSGLGSHLPLSLLLAAVLSSVLFSICLFPPSSQSLRHRSLLSHLVWSVPRAAVFAWHQSILFELFLHPLSLVLFLSLLCKPTEGGEHTRGMSVNRSSLNAVFDIVTSDLPFSSFAAAPARIFNAHSSLSLSPSTSSLVFLWISPRLIWIHGPCGALSLAHDFISSSSTNEQRFVYRLCFELY